MTAGDLAVVLGTVLCSLGFAALIVVLMRVLDTLRSLRSEVESLRNETRPLIAEMQVSTAEARSAMQTARNDLDRFDRVLGSAEAISDAVSGSGRVARVALSTPAWPQARAESSDVCADPITKRSPNGPPLPVR
jgi:hypothetical protein